MEGTGGLGGGAERTGKDGGGSDSARCLSRKSDRADGQRVGAAARAQTRGWRGPGSLGHRAAPEPSRPGGG